MKTIFALTLIFSLGQAFAQDLSLPDAKWEAKFTGYVCAASAPTVNATSELAAIGVVFENMVTDATLDNGLFKASFQEDGVTCRYSAIILADNAASNMRLVESRAYSADEKSACTEGKTVLDHAFEANDYLYYGRPHNLAVMVPSANAEAICGAGAKFIGVNFVVSGRIRN